MTANADTESRFIDEVDSFDLLSSQSLAASLTGLQALEDWYARFKSGLEGDALERMRSLVRSQPHRGLGQQVVDVCDATRRHMKAWPGRWTRLQEAHALADGLGDRVVVLVYGKFNAGKSSFCNFIADRFLAHGKPVSSFRLEAGRIEESTGRFAEGGTETTTDVQGVRLGDKLVLLDTPGLHSVSTGNAELTRRFTESADLMLWLTSSTSPGQVQELDELGRELYRHKVLLPVLTRSDVYEEDEIDGELSHVLRNKTAQNRALQEADVLERAAARLVAMKVDPSLLKPPVSVSVLSARQQGSTKVALAEAGFDRFYDALLSIAGPALAYKRRKREEVFLHYLEEEVLGVMCGEVQALLTALSESSRDALDQLEQQLEQVERAVWRRVVPTLPAVLEKHAASMDEDGLLATMSQSVYDAYADALGEHCGDYGVVTEIADARIELDGDAGYESMVIDEADAMPGRRAVMDVSWERLYSALERAMLHTLRRLRGATTRQCRSAVEQVMAASADFGMVIERYAAELTALERGLRSPVQSTAKSTVR